MTEQRFINEEAFREWAGKALKRSVDPVAGIYGPDSMMWKVGREFISFFGAGRAVLLQLAHPWVANAIDQHSETRNDPMGRGRRTFINVFSMVFGSTEQVMRAANYVYQMHAKIQGTLPEESGAFGKDSYYQANEVGAMLWVHATLWDTQIRMYELVYGPLGEQEREQYYQETKLFAYLFGIPESAIPPTWKDFQHYMDTMLASDRIVARRVGKEMGQMVFNLGGPLQPALSWLELMTAFMLTPRLAREFGLPEDTPENRRRFERGLKLVKTVYPRLPERVRFVPSYIEARGRLAGKARADLVTRGVNRLLLGQQELVSANV